MQVVRVTDPLEFRERTERFLVQEEARHNLMLGMTATLIERPGAYDEFLLWVVEHEGTAVAAAIDTPPHGLMVSRPGHDAALAGLAEGIRAEGIDLPGVVAAVPEVESFREDWEANGRVRARRVMDQRIYRAAEIRPPAGTPGNMRSAGPGDRGLLVDWVGAFSAEALPEGGGTDPDRFVDLRLRGGGVGLVLWEVRGEPVSLAGFGGRTPNGIRIGPVYTPPAHRRRGYAAAVVAALSRRLLEEGRRFCFLYTDLSNRTSNSIYRAVGYEPVCDSREYRFESR